MLARGRRRSSPSFALCWVRSERQGDKKGRATRKFLFVASPNRMTCVTVHSARARRAEVCPMLATSFLFLAVYARLVVCGRGWKVFPLLLFVTSSWYHSTHSSTARRADMCACVGVGAVATILSFDRYLATRDCSSLLPIVAAGSCVLLGWYGCGGHPISAPRHMCMHLVGSLGVYLVE